MFGATQSWHWPIVEYVVPRQLTHSVRLPLGPVPAAHAEHVVRSALTTFGISQSTQSAPKAEKVVPLHAAHSVRSAFGWEPGGQTSHADRAAFGTLPISQVWQRPPAELTSPAPHAMHSAAVFCSFAISMVPARHGWSAAQPCASTYPTAHAQIPPNRCSTTSRQHVPSK
jgi:hypothetical protein